MSTPLRERPDAPLGTLIYRAGLLPAETIEEALEEGVRTGRKLGEILLERGLLEEHDLARLLAGQKGLPFVTLHDQVIDSEAAGLFVEDQARLFRALPLAFEDDNPIVAVTDPTDEILTRNIRQALNRDVRFVVASRGELTDAIARVYGLGQMTPAPPPPEVTDVEEHETEAEGESEAAAEAKPRSLAEAPVEPEAEPQPEPVAEAPVEPQLAREPEPEQVVEPELPAEARPEPVTAPPAPQPAPVAPVPAAEPAPAAARSEQRAAPHAEANGYHPGGQATVRVIVRLNNNDRVEAAVVGDPPAAKAQARALVRYIASKDGDDWPFVGGRFLRPEAIVSVDLVPDEPRAATSPAEEPKTA